jgi:uncharacterized protein (DUF58 family)
MSRTPIGERLGKLAQELRSERQRHSLMARHFLKSMVLLGIAMLAALYSNSSARDGQIVSAGIGAFIALSLAIWVGVRFVPRLAAGVDWDWLPFFTQYRLTRDGWIYIAATVIVLSAAINTSNNLLYMILSALLAVMLLSGFLSGLNFRVLSLRARLPEYCFAKQPFQMTVAVKNPKRVFPTFSLSVGAVDPSPFEFAPYYVPLVQARNQDTRTVEALLSRRGRHSLKEVHLKSRYPFGFIVKGRPFPVDATCIAFPEILPNEELDVAVDDIMGTSERFERGQGLDLYLIRDYVSSDSARHVDWKASAKTASLKTREFAAEESRSLLLVFDRYGQAGDEEHFENMVSQTASLALYLSQEGAEVTLLSDDWSSPPGQSNNLLQSILCYLALVEMTPDAEFVGSGGSGTIVFSLRNPSSTYTQWNATSKSHSMR